MSKPACVRRLVCANVASKVLRTTPSRARRSWPYSERDPHDTRGNYDADRLEEVHVVDAAPGHSDLIGRRLVAIGSVPLEDIDRLIDPLIARDNESSLTTFRNLVYVTPDIFAPLGIIDDAGRRRRTSSRAGILFWSSSCRRHRHARPKRGSHHLSGDGGAVGCGR